MLFGQRLVLVAPAVKSWRLTSVRPRFEVPPRPLGQAAQVGRESLIGTQYSRNSVITSASLIVTISHRGPSGARSSREKTQPLILSCCDSAAREQAQSRRPRQCQARLTK